MNTKRERLQVIHDILKAIQAKDGKIRPTHILYKANLSSQMLNEYLQDLIDRGFVIENEQKKGKTYSLTDKGFEYLSEYKKVTDFIETFGLK